MERLVFMASTFRNAQWGYRTWYEAYEIKPDASIPLPLRLSADEAYRTRGLDPKTKIYLCGPYTQTLDDLKHYFLQRGHEVDRIIT